MSRTSTSGFLGASDCPPTDHDRAPLYREMVRDLDVLASLDLPTAVAGATSAGYVPYHICSSRSVVHRIYHDVKRPSHLLLPVVPTATDDRAGG